MDELLCVFEGLANGMEDCDEGNLWTLDTTLCGSLLVCIHFYVSLTATFMCKYNFVSLEVV